MSALRMSPMSTGRPLEDTLAVMSRTALASAGTWTIQEYAGRLAAKAEPRDYVGQLRALYDDVLRRWRYVQEPGERVPGTPRALLGYVLGADYNRGATCPDAEHCDVLRTEWQNRGFGDCDDISIVIAAGALAMGMQPSWRVATYPGGAHVSVVVQTPTGARISVDPVGHPDHEFGWALQPENGSVRLYELGGGGEGAMSGLPVTWHDGPKRGIVVGDRRPHVVLVNSRDDRGARVLAMPMWAARQFRAGRVVPRTRAYDQFGELYEYNAANDVWAPARTANSQPVLPLGGRSERQTRRAKRRAKRAKNRDKRKARRKAVGKKIKGFFVKLRKGLARVLNKISQSKIATFFRKLKSKFLRNPLIRGAISTVLKAFGVPKAAVVAVMEREASLADRGGRSKLAALVAEGKWGDVAKMVGGSFVDAGKAAAKALIPGSNLMDAAKNVVSKVGLSGFEGQALAGLPDSVGCRYTMEQGGRQYHVAPVAALTGVQGVYLAGQLEVSETPESGRWYRIQPGDTLFGVVSAAFGVPAGAERLKIAKWVNASAANQCLHTKNISETEAKWFGGSRISFMPAFSCSREEQEHCKAGDCYALLWIPPAANVEPPEAPDDEPAPIEPEEPSEPEEPEEPEPVEPDEPEPVEPDVPVPPDDPEDDEPDPPDEPKDEPEPEPVGPVAPPDPDDPAPVEPHPEPPAEPDEPEDEPDEPDEPAPVEDPEPDPAPAPTEGGSSRALPWFLIAAIALGAS